MDFTAFYIDGGEGAHGAVVLAGTTTDAKLLVDGDYTMASAGILYNTDSSSGTMTRTCIALNALRKHTVVRHRDGMAYADGALLGLVDLLDGSSGADLATTGTVGAAETFVEYHLGLHHSAQL